ncbi:outer membrane beta-barrel protein [Gilvimarinus sp. SDUM040013]|uniref:Outer membrane beta-barrel protein n=1 Tax=Gilvimarinus gilvus TaxID=3058038 RepID=A0ABU4S1I7_9GAMM|nr:outer membrane beta-barrel protein [Gilvimarinus sp. SDUM040013]MDO3387820.1 outer membrane beta-barrel protein [Gilvimarinus sp. SDUM040013]MDX6851037.1 outer membrane beta-barrel protein [Gilvimarinus sp. SDUM040013]
MDTWRSIVKVITVGGILMLALPSAADRGQKYEFAFTIPYLTGETFEFDGGASATLNADPGFGFRAGFNHSDHLNVSGQFLWNSTSYDSVRVLDDGEGTEEPVRGVLDGFTASLMADYYFLKGDFTPYISGQVGWAAVDSNIASGPPSSVCWWDPWWGYICNDYQPTYTEDTFSYGVGAGVRFDISPTMFIRAGYQERWLDIDRADSNPSLSTALFELGWMY